MSIETYENETKPTRRKHKVLNIFGWLLLVPFITLTLTRIQPDETSLLVFGVKALIVYFLLPVYLLALLFVLFRQWIKLAVTILLIAAHLFFVSNEFSMTSRPEQISGDSFSVYSHNVLYKNQNADRIADTIIDKKPQVLMLQEVSAFVLDQNTEALSEYPYSYVELGEAASGLAIYSKYPLSNKRLLQSEGFPQMQADMKYKDRLVTLWNIHVYPPVSSPKPGTNPTLGWNKDMDTVTEALKTTNGDVVVAGDFNASMQHARLRHLESLGYEEAFKQTGGRSTGTWPAPETQHSVSAFIRLDHLFTKGALTTTSLEKAPSGGSDHYGNIATIAFTK